MSEQTTSPNEQSEFEQRRRALATKILERIVNDAEFRQQLVDKGDEALRTHGYMDEIQELAEAHEDAEVAGYRMMPNSLGWCCISFY